MTNTLKTLGIIGILIGIEKYSGEYIEFEIPEKEKNKK